MPAHHVKRLTKKILNPFFAPFVNHCADSIANKILAHPAFSTNERQTVLNDSIDPIVSRILAHPAFSPRERLRETQARLRKEINELRARIEINTPKNPCVHGFKVYSQTDEDGIIEYILNQIPDHTRTFIEIGCGAGNENNTHYLALKSYKGCWADGSEENIAAIKDALGALKFKTLLIQKHFVSIDNIGEIIQAFCNFISTSEPTVFSLDIDGNDFHVMNVALKHFRPLVICVEYNSKFPPPTVLTMAYNARHTWAGDDYHGASLQAFCDLLTDYKLVSCNLSGANAFFVRRDCSAAFADYTPAQLFQPFRENLIDLRAEHRPTLKWLKDKLATGLN